MSDELTPEQRKALGLTVPTPKRPTLEDVAEQTGADPDELRIMGTIKNAADLERAQREIAALRQARHDAEARKIRERAGED